MKKSKLSCILLAAAAGSLMLTGCSSSLASNSSIYMNQMSQKLAIWTSGGASESTSTAEAEADDGRTAIGSPANWTVSETGHYSFDAVENADYYIIYLYDTQSESTSYAYISANIEDDGSASYSGELSDLFSYCYGLYNAEVIAYPAVGTTDMKKSAPSEYEFTVTGEVEAPEIAYLWDCFTGTLSVELINVENYAASSAPTLVDVTFTNTADSSDVIELSFENATMDTDTYMASTTEVSADAEYAITGKVTWNSDVVTNPEQEVDLGTVSTASDKNAMTEGYGYLNSSIYLSMDYPMVVTNFDPVQGGDAGTWYFFINAFTTNKGVAIPSTFVDCLNFQGEKGAMGADYHDGEDVSFTVTPAETVTAGSAYSYTLKVAGPRDVVSMFDGFFYNDMPDGEGTLELKEDGTFEMAIITPASDGTAQAGPGGPRNISESTISGLWVDNGDGTLTLSYDHTSAALTE